MANSWQKPRQMSITNTPNLPSSLTPSSRSRPSRDRQARPIHPFEGELEDPVQQLLDQDLVDYDQWGMSAYNRYSDKPLRVSSKVPKEPDIYYKYDPNEHVPISLPYDRSGSPASNSYYKPPPVPPREHWREPEINERNEYVPMPRPPSALRSATQQAELSSSSSKAVPQPQRSHWSGHTTESEVNSKGASWSAEQSEPEMPCSNMSVDQIRNERLRDILSSPLPPPKRPRDHNRAR
jgi:hypothetical protein